MQKATRVVRTRPRKPDNRARNRIFIVAGLLLVVCGWSLYAASHLLRPSEMMRTSMQKAPGDRSEELRTGEILVVPLEGNICQKKIIDNRTGQIRDGGTVVCDEAVSWNSNLASSPQAAQSRMNAIRDAFSRK